MWGWREQCLSFWMKKTCARHPQTRRWETSGLRLNQASWRVMPLRVDVGRQFQTWIWAVRASPQSEGGNFASKSIAEMLSAMVRFARSATPILLWSISSWMAPVDATFICEFDKSLGHVFSPFVILELLHFPLEVVLCKCLVGSNASLFRLSCIAARWEVASSMKVIQ